MYNPLDDAKFSDILTPACICKRSLIMKTEKMFPVYINSKRINMDLQRKMSRLDSFKLFFLSLFAISARSPEILNLSGKPISEAS